VGFAIDRAANEISRANTLLLISERRAGAAA